MAAGQRLHSGSGKGGPAWVLHSPLSCAAFRFEPAMAHPSRFAQPDDERGAALTLNPSRAAAKGRVVTPNDRWRPEQR
jgi:hypothetical protein